MRPGRRLLRPGCSGPDVKALQRKLDVAADGVFGPRTAAAVKKWKREHGRKKSAGPVVTRAMWQRLGFSTKEWWPVSRTAGLTPGQIVNRIVLESQGFGFPHMTLQRVRDANAAHGPTVHGTRSDHQGPPDYAWAADISNGSSPTDEMDRFARKIAHWFGGPWSGSGITDWWVNGYRYQMLYRTDTGGNHWNHIHIGIRR